MEEAMSFGDWIRRLEDGPDNCSQEETGKREHEGASGDVERDGYSLQHLAFGPPYTLRDIITSIQVGLHGLDSVADGESTEQQRSDPSSEQQGRVRWGDGGGGHWADDIQW